MQYTVLVKALHPIKGWVKFEVAVEAKNPTDAAIQAKRQPSVKDYSVYNVLSVALVPKEQAQEQVESPKPTLVQSKPPEPMAQPVVKKGF